MILFTIITYFLMIAFIIYCLYLWRKKDYKDEYFYCALVGALYIAATYLYQVNEYLIVLKIIFIIQIYFFALSGVLPLMRVLKSSKIEREQKYYQTLNKFFNIVSMLYITIGITIGWLYYIIIFDLSKVVGTLIAIYTIMITSIFFSTIYKLGYFNFKFVLRSWLTYIFFWGSLEIYFVIWGENVILSSIIYCMSAILFFITRFKANSIK